MSTERTKGGEEGICKVLVVTVDQGIHAGSQGL